MLNILTREWQDKEGKIWPLKELQFNHLQNIKVMLEDIINGKRDLPPGCTQSRGEIELSLRYINKEIQKRQDVSECEVKVLSTWEVPLRADITTVEHLAKMLELIPPDSILVRVAGEHLFFKDS